MKNNSLPCLPKRTKILSCLCWPYLKSAHGADKIHHSELLMTQPYTLYQHIAFIMKYDYVSSYNCVCLTFICRNWMCFEYVSSKWQEFVRLHVFRTNLEASLIVGSFDNCSCLHNLIWHCSYHFRRKSWKVV